MSNKDYTNYEYVDMGGYRFPFKLLIVKTNEQGKTVFRPHWHEQLEILFIKKGTIFIQCDQIEFFASTGDIVVFNACQLHKGINCLNELEIYVLVIDSKKLIKEIDETCDNNEMIRIAQNLVFFCNKISGDVLLLRTISEIFEEYGDKRKHFSIVIKANVYKVIVSLLRNNISAVLKKSEVDSRMRMLEQYSGVLLYIEKRIDKELTVAELAKQVNLSRYRFIHVFKLLTGHTLSQYINELRMAKAEMLLKTTSLNITELADLVGFNDPNYFCRVFKKKNGASPIQYRKRTSPEA